MDSTVAIIKMLVDQKTFVGNVSLTDKCHHSPEDSLPFLSEHTLVFAFAPNKWSHMNTVACPKTMRFKERLKIPYPRRDIYRLVMKYKAHKIEARRFLVRFKTA